MGDVINLRAARKAKARSDAQQQAAESRARFGRTKAQKAADARDAAEKSRALEGARREQPDQEGPDGR